MFQRGQRVLADGKPGMVVYTRMAPPDFSKVMAVSVFLDERARDLSYSGTIFPASKVKEA